MTLAPVVYVALDLHVQEELCGDADACTPEEHQADLRRDVRPEDELSGPQADPGGDDTRTDDAPEIAGRIGEIATERS